MTVDKESFLEIVGDRGQDILDVITFIIEIRDGKIVSVEEQYQP
jgi:ketosteroid isomerase-like protein